MNGENGVETVFDEGVVGWGFWEIRLYVLQEWSYVGRRRRSWSVGNEDEVQVRSGSVRISSVDIEDGAEMEGD